MVLTEQLRKYGIPYKTDYKTAALSTIRAGGQASLLIEVGSLEDIIRSIEILGEYNVRFLPIGGFSNTVISDEGYDGAIIHTKGFSSFEVCGDEVIADSGILFSNFSKKLALLDRTIAEELSGIPGSVGGMIKNNAGAFGVSISDRFISGEFLDITSGKVISLEKNEMSFSYRTSLLHKRTLFALRARFKLIKKDNASISKGMKYYAEKRRTTQPSEPSLGSFFKRSGDISAGALIDSLGLKGYQVGGASFSKKHAGFIVNQGGATVSDIDLVAKAAEEAVLRVYGVQLEREAEIIF